MSAELKAMERFRERWTAEWAYIDAMRHEPHSWKRETAEITKDVLDAVAAEGYAIVKVGEVPPWMERVHTHDRIRRPDHDIPSEHHVAYEGDLYRLKEN
ncbi:hypothetical protein GTQ99_00435 [Kineococcus sp. T13]|uniref:hypothetical protein n=1 Tax=Kineococcus vitellinus TaxID=2696565 RepID=UPI001413286A|nr:hypothetical protein [Kineococcus vitellinus]NAZ73898.1 hypothetical protein [Kineococcus vitellinus]